MEDWPLPAQTPAGFELEITLHSEGEEYIPALRGLGQRFLLDQWYDIVE